MGLSKLVIFLIFIQIHSSISEETPIKLDYEENHNYTKTLNEANNNYSFKLREDYEDKEIYHLNIIVTSLACNSSNPENKLEIIIETSDEQTKYVSICDNFYPSWRQHYKHKLVLDNAKAIKVNLNSDPEDRAEIVVSIYKEYDITDKRKECSCGDNSFCCTDGITCRNEKLYTNKFRCIPRVLKCDGYPNCGLNCNLDESEVEGCEEARYCLSLNGFTYCDWTFVWFAMLFLFLFTILPIAFVFVILCYCRNRKSSPAGRRAFRRNSPNQNEIVIRHSPAHDIPPSYDDLVQKPPSFVSAMELRELNNTNNVGNSSQSQN